MASISAPRTAPFRSPTQIGSRSCRSGRRAPAARCRRSCISTVRAGGWPGPRASRHSSRAGVKHELAKIGFAGTNSWAVDFSVATLVSVVLKRLKTEADEATGHATTRLVLGHPVVFAGADRAHLQESEAEAFKRLREAAQAAGFEEVEFMAEPVAAVIGEERHAGVEIAVDFGGGTFDVAVMDSRREL